ncbi:peptidase M16 inactive domain-containing protein [Lineolata rhizophorae]|uniref:Mitochondrial-processing peptidase subunit alpha n=1 Tax=Lineolata rhizophorae TaxID=578093 RepID=A0A6A6NPD3_9PEZI|nr:peptidase M16 inactive domain-containing protein [Lineolata rhizophorae]
MIRSGLSRGLTRAVLRRAPVSLKARAATARRPFASVVAEEKDPVELDRVTTLPNGIRVATEALPGHFSGIGVYVDAGSRYENASLRGVSHIIDRLAFKSTSRRSADAVFEACESLGGNIQCASSREALMYQAATFNSAVPSAVGLLAETIREPRVTDEEVGMQLATAEYEIDEIWSKPELILPELVHMAAYKDNTLGNPLLCPRERLGEITRETVLAYRQSFYKPERIVVAFAGVNHEEAIRLTENYFGDMKGVEGPVLSGVGSETSISSPPSSSSSSTDSSESSFTSHQIQQQQPTYSSSTPPQEPSRLLSKIPFFKNISTSATSRASIDTTQPLPSSDTLPSSAPRSSLLATPDDLTRPSHYTGGFMSLPPQPPSPNPALPSFSHIHMAFEALPISSPDIYALATLQTLLGGGGSFSAGGPGKGMYSRLFTNVLNHHAWVESCVAFNHSYTDSGLFGIAASCAPHMLPSMLDVMCRELAALTAPAGFGALQEQEVRRAKNQLMSSLLMNLESRMVELEDLGRQVQVHGRKVGVKEMCERIQKLTVEDLREVARKVVGGAVENKGAGTGAPTVVVQEADAGGVGGVRKREFGWADMQGLIRQWKLGRR